MMLNLINITGIISIGILILSDRRDGMFLNIGTPALLFKGVCLLMSAYILRFTRLSRLIRNFNIMFKNESSIANVKEQINIFAIRLRIIKLIHIFGVLSLFFEISAMLFTLLGGGIIVNLLFAAGLIFFLAALISVLIEIYFSLKALDINLEIEY